MLEEYYVTDDGGDTLMLSWSIFTILWCDKCSGSWNAIFLAHACTMHGMRSVTLCFSYRLSFFIFLTLKYIFPRTERF